MDNDQPVKTSVTIITVNGKQFVSGLFWQPLTRPRAFMKEAREIGKREGMDIVAIRHGVIMQAGFVSKNMGVIKGMYSLAASLADKLGKSWLGVFEIDDDQFALVAVHDGAIVPGCDLIGDRDTISNKLRVVYSYCKWEKVYAPQSFEFGGEILDINQLLQAGSLKRENQLRALTFGFSPKEWGLLASVLIIAVGGLYGYNEWTNHQEKLRREALIRAEQARQAELAKLNANAKNAQTQQALDHPWAKQPAAIDFARECMLRINDLPLVAGGWVFLEAKCDGKLVLAAYKRMDFASVNDLLAEAQSAFGVVPTIGGGGDNAVVSLPVDVKYGGDDPLQPTDVAAADLASHLQKLGVVIKLVEKSPQQSSPQSALPGQEAHNEAKPAAVPDWRTFTFKIDTELSPESVFEGVKSDGLRFTELAVRLHDETPKLIWNVAGELNAK